LGLSRSHAQEAELWLKHCINEKWRAEAEVAKQSLDNNWTAIEVNLVHSFPCRPYTYIRLVVRRLIYPPLPAGEDRFLSTQH
jgi:hypothetical protein